MREGEEACRIFEKDLVPARLLEELSVFRSQQIVPWENVTVLGRGFRSVLLQFSRFGICMRRVTASSCRWRLGLLLDFALEKTGLPVGRVESLYVYPLSFAGFLIAAGEPLLAQSILDQKPGVEMAPTLHAKALDLVAQYLAIKGDA